MFLSTVQHILGSIRNVGEDVSHVKGITQTMKAEFTEGFKETQGKLIWLTFWFEEIHQENLHHAENNICLAVWNSVCDNFLLQRNR